MLDCMHQTRDEEGLVFENYKMQLEKKHHGSTPIAYDLRARTQPLLKVSTLSHKFVKDQAMEDVNPAKGYVSA